MDNIFTSLLTFLANTEVQLLLVILAVLAIAAAVMLQGRRRRPVPLTMPASVTAELQSQTSDQTDRQHNNHTAPLTMMDRSTRGDLSDDRQMPVSADPVQAEPALFVGRTEDETIENLSLEAAQAKCAGLLAIVKQQLEASASPGAATSLRELIRIAAANGLHDQHAAARLELGELARQDGDLITACEHWQIARGLFHELKNPPRVKAVEKRMSDHGCPTDWVLNDF